MCILNAAQGFARCSFIAFGIGSFGRLPTMGHFRPAPFIAALLVIGGIEPNPGPDHLASTHQRGHRRYTDGHGAFHTVLACEALVERLSSADVPLARAIRDYKKCPLGCIHFMREQMSLPPQGPASAIRVAELILDTAARTGPDSRWKIRRPGNCSQCKALLPTRTSVMWYDANGACAMECPACSELKVVPQSRVCFMGLAVLAPYRDGNPSSVDVPDNAVFAATLRDGFWTISPSRSWDRATFFVVAENASDLPAHAEKLHGRVTDTHCAFRTVLECAEIALLFASVNSPIARAVRDYCHHPLDAIRFIRNAMGLPQHGPASAIRVAAFLIEAASLSSIDTRWQLSEPCDCVDCGAPLPARVPTVWYDVDRRYFVECPACLRTGAQVFTMIPDPFPCGTSVMVPYRENTEDTDEVEIPQIAKFAGALRSSHWSASNDTEWQEASFFVAERQQCRS